jgi:hypothetical protein
MDTITIETTSAMFEQARRRIQKAQSLVACCEGRTLDFETADEISRELLASIKELTPAAIISPEEEYDDLTDEEILELESRLAHDDDDSQFWTLGGTH